MRRSLLVLVFVLTVPLFAQTDLVEQGVALYDAGKYDEAIAKFQAALAADPANELAAYELGLTYFAKGEYPACKSATEAASARKGKYQAELLTVLGNCLDGLGETKAAIRSYRRGLKIAPDDTQLLYNLAVSLLAQNETAEAMKLLKKELVLERIIRPATSHSARSFIRRTSAWQRSSNISAFSRCSHRASARRSWPDACSS